MWCLDYGDKFKIMVTFPTTKKSASVCDPGNWENFFSNNIFLTPNSEKYLHQKLLVRIHTFIIIQMIKFIVRVGIALLYTTQISAEM